MAKRKKAKPLEKKHASSRQKTKQRSCSAKRATNGDAAVSLRVLKGGTVTPIAKSKAGRWRAIVLAAVQVLIIAHIVHWLVKGETVSPIEPSESMEFWERGVINAGFVFFALAIISTAVFGRWVCGWGCHIVMLQDLCGWLLKRVGIHPKPFRSRLLLYVPLILALYMFVWPAIERFAIAPWIGAEVHSLRPHLELTREGFWDTFPPWYVAVPFLAICGFGTVYFLGQKGYCTYACPYAGVFVPLEKLAKARIRVTDDCEHCGHCTAVCTSNVRVHEEVRDFGMVVDPGCMKCLDCVSVCPNDALFFGFKSKTTRKAPAKKDATPTKRKFDLSWPEEIALTFVFLASFVAVRNVYELIPMLLASGTAAITTFLVWRSWRIVRDKSVNFHRFRLKYKGAIRPAGWVFLAFTAVVLLLTVQSGVVNFARWRGDRAESHIAPDITMEQVFFPREPLALTDEQQAAVDRGVRWYTLASPISDGGIGLHHDRRVDLMLAWLRACEGEFEQAETILRRAIDRGGRNHRLCALLSRAVWRQALDAAQSAEQALAYYEEILPEEPAYHDLLDEYIPMAKAAGRTEQAIAICRDRLEIDDQNAHTMWALGRVLLNSDRTDEGVQLLRQSLTIDPDSADRWLEWSQINIAIGDLAGAAGAIEHAKGLDAQPEIVAAYELPVVIELAIRDRLAGEFARAGGRLQKALELTPGHPDVLLEMARLKQASGDLDAALPIMNSLMRAYPDPTLPYETARWLREAMRLEDARLVMQFALQIDPDDPGMNAFMSEILTLMGRDQEAMEYADRARRRDAASGQ